MKAIVSITNDPQYSFFLPIISWCWNRIGVDVICFVPAKPNESTWFAMSEINKDGSNKNLSYGYKCPPHKEATYAQCSRLYAAGLYLPEGEMLVTSDVDMAVFKTPPYIDNGMAGFTVLGQDLVPSDQVPICYLSATVSEWRKVFDMYGRSYQECLDDLLGGIDADHFRGNYWAKDQEEANNKIANSAGWVHYEPRARPGTQFAKNRVDRDDINWRSYCGPDLIDAHLWRPGYTDENFAKILELLQAQYPEDSFDWLVKYKNDYVSLL